MTFDLDLEMSLLGGCIMYGIRPPLGAEDYCDARHRIIHKALCQIFDTHSTLDTNLLIDQMERDGVLKAAGGAIYVSSLLEVAAREESIPEYAKKILEYSLLRKVKKICSEIVNNGYRDPYQIKNEFDKIFSESRFVDEDSSLKNISQKLIEKLNKDRKLFSRGVTTPFHKLTQWTGGFHPGDLIVVAARPGMGKTSFLLQLAFKAARSGENVSFLSLEMGKDQIVSRVLSMLSGVNLLKLRTGPLVDNELRGISAQMDLIRRTNFNVYDTGVSVLSGISHLIYREKPSFVCIDYLQLIHDDNKSERRDLEIANITRSLKRLAVEMKIPIIVASQLNRGIEHRSSFEPMLADLRDSGSIEQDADMVIFIANIKDREDRKHIIIAKHRNGPTGKIQLMWVSKIASFVDIEETVG